MSAGRIDVSVDEAMMANAAARSAAASTITTPQPVISTMPSSMFAVGAAAAAAVAAAHEKSGQILDRRLPHLDARTEQAVAAYDAMNEDNRRALSSTGFK